MTTTGKEIRNKFLIIRRYGPISKIETLYRMTLKKLLKPDAYLGNLDSIPYEITQEGRSAMLELECRRAQAQYEYLQNRIR